MQEYADKTRICSTHISYNISVTISNASIPTNTLIIYLTQEYADKTRRVQLLNDQLHTDLNAEKSAVLKMEGNKSMLERQNKELKCKLAELETEIKGRTKATISSLESKVRHKSEFE